MQRDSDLCHKVTNTLWFKKYFKESVTLHCCHGIDHCVIDTGTTILTPEHGANSGTTVLGMRQGNYDVMKPIMQHFAHFAGHAQQSRLYGG